MWAARSRQAALPRGGCGDLGAREAAGWGWWWRRTAASAHCPVGDMDATRGTTTTTVVVVQGEEARQRQAVALVRPPVVHYASTGTVGRLLVLASGSRDVVSLPLPAISGLSVQRWSSAWKLL